NVTKEEYAQTIIQATDFMKGGASSTITLLTGLMESASENLEFEKAIKLRDRISAIRKINEHQKVIFTGVKEQDVIAVVKNGKETCIVLLKFRNERLLDKETYFIGDIDLLSKAREQFILQYYENADDIPKQLLIDGEIDNLEDVKRYLCEKLKKKTDIILPKRGINTQLIEMARNNAAQQLSHFCEKTGKELSVLDELSKLLNINKIPVYIEAYDISNIGQNTVVGGMIVFENAKPLKSAYRKFDIKTVVGTDDYACMYEVLERRIIRYFEQDKTGIGFGRLPDLILLDGGKGHVSTIKPLFEKYNFPVALFGMVKDDKHKTRAIAKDGGEIAINSNRGAFSLISSIQDEVHRFSIHYSRSKHKTTSFELELTKIDGIGEKRAILLYKHFKTQIAIKEASIEELCTVEGMNKKTANAVYLYFR
ncbi:MAG: excinuclease ABC subunit UvrC, partial [Oscillospiraceae bacterium]